MTQTQIRIKVMMIWYTRLMYTAARFVNGFQSTLLATSFAMLSLPLIDLSNFKRDTIMSELLKGTDDAALVYNRRIRRSNEHDLILVIIPELCGVAMTDTLREYFAKLIQKRIWALTRERPKIATVRAMVAWSDAPIEPTPEWCKKWVYIKNRNRFYNTKTKEEYTRLMFNYLNKGRMPKDWSNKSDGVSNYVIKKNFVGIADFYAFRPETDVILVKLESGDHTVCNTFDPLSVPEIPSEYTLAGLTAIDRVKECIGFIAGTPERADLLTQWLAHQVQRPGEIVGWSPLIASKVMDREFLPRLLGGVLGNRNVGVRNATQVHNEMHNGWTTEKSVMVFYELRATAYYPGELIDDISNYVRSDYNYVNARGSAPVVRMPNTTNYLAFTRYFDELPDAKCWWVVSTSPDAMAKYKEAIGNDSCEYYESLNYAVQNRKAEVRKWLSEYEIDDDFYDPPIFNEMLKD